MKPRALVVVLFLLVALAAAFGPAPALAQDETRRQPPPAANEPRQIDAYGDLGHCDWTARLDNFAVELQNNPSAMGYVVSYNAPERQGYAPRQLRFTRHYLVESRGIAATRFAVFEGGARADLKEGLTELWIVPEGAEPPVAPPADSKYAEGFSGRFGAYSADPDLYQEVYEMGVADSELSRSEFAAKLKQQPDSVGYLLISAPAGGAPGAWRRLARREEQLLSALGIDASRLKSLDGGRAGGRLAEVEMWVLPRGAPPPPAAAKEKVEATFNSAAKLHTFDVYADDAETERWMLENLAEFLRENPHASALLVAREPTPLNEIVWERRSDADEPAETGEAQETPPEPAETDPTVLSEPEEVAETMKESAERWKDLLIARHRVEAQRVVVAQGRAVRWGAGRINIWVIPEKAKWPDPSARDEDEAEREQLHGVAAEADARPAAASPR